MEDELDSIFVPMSVHTMSASTTFNKNLKIYYEGVNILKDQGRDIGSTYINPETSETIVTNLSLIYIQKQIKMMANSTGIMIKMVIFANTFPININTLPNSLITN